METTVLQALGVIGFVTLFNVALTFWWVRQFMIAHRCEYALIYKTLQMVIGLQYPKEKPDCSDLENWFRTEEEPLTAEERDSYSQAVCSGK